MTIARLPKPVHLPLSLMLLTSKPVILAGSGVGATKATARSALPFHQRVIVEAFSRADVSLAKASRVLNPMLSIGNLEAFLEFVPDQPLRHVALPTAQLTRCPGAARKVIEAGRRVFAFTSVDEKFMARHGRTYATTFYTDSWYVGHRRCEGAACRGPDGHSSDVR